MRYRVAPLLVVVLLTVPTAGTANHPQGCNPLLTSTNPTGGQDCPKAPPDELMPQEYVLSGCAYGAFARTTTPVPLTLSNVAPANFVNTPGFATTGVSTTCPIRQQTTFFNQVLGLSTPPLPVEISADVVTSTVDSEFPGFAAPAGYSLSSAEIVGLKLSIPSVPLTIEADVVRAVAYCTSQAGNKGRNDDGPAGYGPSTIVGMTITHPFGTIPVNVRPGEDTWISIPGVGGIMLRETWDLENPPYGPNQPWKSFTENMIHVYLTGLVQGDVVVAHAHCDGVRLQGKANLTPRD